MRFQTLVHSDRRQPGAFLKTVTMPNAFFPSVMLFPNAMKLVAARRGGTDTITVKVQALVRSAESVTVHVTMELPTGKSVPLSGEQVIRSGGRPAMMFGGS